MNMVKEVENPHKLNMLNLSAVLIPIDIMFIGINHLGGRMDRVQTHYTKLHYTNKFLLAFCII